MGKCPRFSASSGAWFTQAMVDALPLSLLPLAGVVVLTVLALANLRPAKVPVPVKSRRPRR